MKKQKMKKHNKRKLKTKKQKIMKNSKPKSLIERLKNNPNVGSILIDLPNEVFEMYSKDIPFEYNVKNNQLNLVRKFPGMGDVKVIITRTIKGFNYEDVGMFNRNFTDLDYMMWEFDLPKSLKKVIENLPISDKSKKEFESKESEEIVEEIGKQMMELTIVK